MEYDEIIKSKIINIYHQFRSIRSEDCINKNIDFSFLNSYELKKIISEIEENEIVFNVLGESFIRELKNYHSQKRGLSFFDIKNITYTQKLQQSTIEKIQKKVSI